MYFILFIQFLHFGAQDPGPGSEAAAGLARARPAAALGHRPGPGPQNVKIIWKKYEHNVIWHFHMVFIFISYYFHIIFTVWGA